MLLKVRGPGERRPPGPANQAGLNLADAFDRGRERFGALFPLRRADLTGVGADIDRGLDLEDQLLGVAAAAFRSAPHILDHVVGTAYNGSAVARSSNIINGTEDHPAQ